MLSKIELEFLKSPESFNANYTYGIRHRLNRKVKALSEEIGLLQKSGYLNLTENCKVNSDLTEICKNQQNPNQAVLSERGENWCGRRDLNPGRQRGRLMS
jgi:hypothetical protein